MSTPPLASAAAGLQPHGFPDDIVIQGVPLSELVAPFSPSGSVVAEVVNDVGYAVTQAVLTRTTTGASNIVVTLGDPFRQILRSGIFALQDVLTYDGLDFTLVQFTKTSAQLQLTFEASGVAALRKESGVIVYQATGTDLYGFAAQLVHAVP